MTTALLGPSGVGKSTLVNTLAGEDRLATGEIGGDGSGRHTTTRRELVVLPGGGLVVDNPGMRELHLWVADEGLEETFEDIAALAAQCRFSDCRHESEPGCAVRAALADGRLSPERWRSYRELQNELAELDENSRAAALPRRAQAPGAETVAGYDEATFAAPFVTAVVKAQSTAALFESRRSGFATASLRPCSSRRPCPRAQCSTRSYVWPSIVAARISPSYERVEQGAGRGADQGDAVRSAVLRLDVESEVASGREQPVSAMRLYSVPSPPFTRTSAMPSSTIADPVVFAISTKPPVSAPTWS